MRATRPRTPPASASCRSRCRGNRHVSREEVLAIAGVTGRTSLLFLDVETARERLKTNPWIADATVLKLYPGELQIGIKEREAFALWQKDGRVSVIADDGTVLEPYVAPRLVKLPLVVGRGAAARAKEFLALIDRYPDIRDQVRASILIGERRWNLRLRNGLDVRLPEIEVASALERLVALDRDNKLLTRDIAVIDLRLADRVTVRLSRSRRAGARGCAQGEEAASQEGRARMSSVLQFGLTPKTKPLSPKRSALIAALDVGTSKIACLIARLRPQTPQRCLRRRTHAIEVVGFGHTVARGMKAGAVVDLGRGRAGDAPGVRSRRAHRQDAARIGGGFGLGRQAHERTDLRDRQCRGQDRRRRRYRARACPPAASIRCGRAGRCCIRCRSAIRSMRPPAFAIRAACSGAVSASTCT